ncbi:glycoside hydrolase family 13 domain protein [Gemmatirosa kalamazoonensis]|uniref:Glycoside hydrolase family 13 domain protein n=1 Tax=Gemmatirosa kalamazoonensis TaxID=861299 RepID=W0RLJ4_9BACT|nr:glycogen-binding domain-containing protein [Gemmatirosa kalamazoonensis]AHG91959.1 glycoside hydrolase family 13 domain protein [Gemmatirosa kalamazoonensis]
MRHTAGRRLRRVAVALASALASVLASALASVSARAQLTPTLDASVGPARAGGADSVPLSALSPALRVDLSRLAIGASGDVPLTGALRGVAGRAALLAAAPVGGGWRLATGAAVERSARWGALASWRGGLTSQLAYVHGAGGAWLGVEGSRVDAVGGAQPFRGVAVPNGSTVPMTDTSARAYTRVLDPAAYRATALSLGAWRSLGSWVGALTVRAGMQRVPGRPPSLRELRDSVFFCCDTLRIADSIAVLSRWAPRTQMIGDSGTASARRRLSELEARLAWTRGRVAVLGAAGVQLAGWAGTHLSQGPNTASLAWATVDGTVALGRTAAVTFGAGTRPPAVDLAALLSGAPSPAVGRARYASLGVRLSSGLFQRPALPPSVRPAAAAFALAPATERGQYTLRVRVPAARVVELSGDFTKWRPVSMQRGGADVWEVVLPIAPGTHRVSIRVDGDAWTAPPGLARVADDFDGSAGVLVVP